MVVPKDSPTSERLSQLGLASGLANGVLDGAAVRSSVDPDVLPVARLRSYHDVEDLASDALELLGRQSTMFGEWGDAIHMAIGELCDNALLHGKNSLGTYAVADRRTDRSQFRLAIVDLGIGIPEHLRSRYPEWHNDTGAIGHALVRGVSGTGDAQRGNGFAEVIEKPHENALIRAGSAADLDIRSGKGRLGVELFGGNPRVVERNIDRPRRGTWITYTITTAAQYA